MLNVLVMNNWCVVFAGWKFTKSTCQDHFFCQVCTVLCSHISEVIEGCIEVMVVLCVFVSSGSFPGVYDHSVQLCGIHMCVKWSSRLISVRVGCCFVVC